MIVQNTQRTAIIKQTHISSATLVVESEACNRPPSVGLAFEQVFGQGSWAEASREEISPTLASYQCSLHTHCGEICAGYIASAANLLNGALSCYGEEAGETYATKKRLRDLVYDQIVVCVQG